LPTGTANGDYVVACIEYFVRPSGNVVTWNATGFSPILLQSDVPSTGKDVLDCRGKIAASEPSTYTWSETSSLDGVTAFALTYRNVLGVDGSSFQSATANFPSGSAGDPICVATIGASSGQLCGTIMSYVSATQVHLTLSSSSALTGLWFAYGSDDTSAFQSMLSSAPCSTRGCKVMLDSKGYVLTGGLAFSPNIPIVMEGSGAGASNVANAYINGNTHPNANSGTRLMYLTQTMTKAGITASGSVGNTSMTVLDHLQDLSLLGGGGS